MEILHQITRRKATLTDIIMSILIIQGALIILQVTAQGPDPDPGPGFEIENTDLDCEICGGSSGIACSGPDAPDVQYKLDPNDESEFPPALPSMECEDGQFCSKKYIIRGSDDPNGIEIVERGACILNPPHIGCKLSLDVPTSDQKHAKVTSTLECYCNQIMGHFLAFNDDYKPPAKITVEAGGFCNGRLSCFQCADCLLPENPAPCTLENKTLVEQHMGRIAFCTVELRDGHVRRGCGRDPGLFPEEEWPDCGNHWNHSLGKCKCYEQQCNNNFFYVNKNLGTALKRNFLPDTRINPVTLTIPPVPQLTCHKCSVTSNDTEEIEACYQPASKYISNGTITNGTLPKNIEICPAGSVCFKEYLYGETSNNLIKSYQIVKKGCTDGTMNPVSQYQIEHGCQHIHPTYDANTGEINPGTGVLFCFCDTHMCNEYTKCHQCQGSGPKCDFMHGKTRGENCAQELLLPGESLATTKRQLGVAQFCTILMTGDVVSRMCQGAMDFGTGLGSFHLQPPTTFVNDIPPLCNRWRWNGGLEHHRLKAYQECHCYTHGCNSQDIIGIAPPSKSQRLDQTNKKSSGSMLLQGIIAGYYAVCIVLNIIMQYV